MAAIARWAAAFLLLAGCSQAPDEYPSQPIRLIVPFPAGGSSDIIARVISERAARALGQQIVIDNRAGAGGNIGTETASRAAPDGYTLVECTIGTCAINPSVYANTGYDLERDFRPVVLFAQMANVLAVHPAVQADSVQALVALARASPGQIAYASSGYGSSPHLSGELLGLMAGVELLHVPYKGSAPAIIDLRGGQTHLFFDNTPSILPHVTSGALRALAVTSAKRLPSLPDVPTLEEAALTGFVSAPGFGGRAPKQMPDAVVQRVDAGFNEAIADPEVQVQLRKMEAEPAGGTPEAFGEHIRAEVARWAEVVRARGITAQELQ